MRKIVVTTLVLILAISMVACGGKPKGMTQEVYDRGKNVVQTTERYLKGDLTDSQAYESTWADYKAMDALAEYGNLKDLQVKTYSLVISVELSPSSAFVDKELVEENLESLKKALKG